MEDDLLKDLFELLPAFLVDEELLKLNCVKPKWSYKINDTIFEESNKEYEDTELVEFEVRTQERDEKESADIGNVQSNIDFKEVTTENSEIGVIANSKTYLSDHNWNTLLSLGGLFQCAVCDEIMAPNIVDDHIASVSHKKNLKQYPPLTEYQTSIVRKIENYYHCGVCNMLPEDISYHINTETHKQNYLHSINKVHKDVQQKTIDKVSDSKENEPFDRNINIIKDILGCLESINKSISSNDVLKSKSINSNVNSSKVQNPNVLLPNLNISNMPGDVNAPVKDIFNVIDPKVGSETQKPVKIDSSETISKKKAKKKKLAVVSNVVPNITKNFDLDFPALKGADKPTVSSTHCSENKPDQVNENNNLIDNTANADNANKITVENIFSNAPASTFSYATAAKKTPIPVPESVIVNYKKKKIEMKYFCWHMIICRRNKLFYCMACKEPKIKDILSHCSCVKHVESLQRCGIVEAFDDFVIRKVDDKFLHCGLCNNLQYTSDMMQHLAKKHAHVKTQTATKNTDSVRNVIHSGTDTVKTDHVIHTDIGSNLRKPADIFKSEIKIRPFDMDMTIHLLTYNMLFIHENKLLCGLCDCFVLLDPVHHICWPRHTELLSRTPFIPNFKNNLIREIRGFLHCALCNILSTRDNILTHIMNPPHPMMFKKALHSEIGASASVNTPTVVQNPSTPQLIGNQIPMAPFGGQMVDHRAGIPFWATHYPSAMPVPNANVATDTQIPKKGDASLKVGVENKNGVNMAKDNAQSIDISQKNHQMETIAGSNNEEKHKTTSKDVADAFAKVASRVFNANQIKPLDESEMSKTVTSIANKGKSNKLDSTTNKSKCEKESVAENTSLDTDIDNQLKVDGEKRNWYIPTKGYFDVFKTLKDFETNEEPSANAATDEPSNINDNTVLNEAVSEDEELPEDIVQIDPDVIETATELSSEKREIDLDGRVSAESIPLKSNDLLKSIDEISIATDLSNEKAKTETHCEIKSHNPTLDDDEKMNNAEKTVKDDFIIDSRNSNFNDNSAEIIPVLGYATQTTLNKSEVTEPELDKNSNILEENQQHPKLINNPPKSKTNKKSKKPSKASTTKTNMLKAQKPADNNKSNEVNNAKNETTFESNETGRVSRNDIVSNDDASSVGGSISDLNEIVGDSNEPYDPEEFIYLRLKTHVVKVTFSSYNSLVPDGEGNRYCFVCWETVLSKDLQQHVCSRNHLGNLKGSKYMDHYNDNMIRWKNSTHHCSLCNVIIIDNLQSHLSWQHHANTLSEMRKNTIKTMKNMKKNNYRTFTAFTTKKIYNSANQVKLKSLPCDNLTLDSF